MSNILAQTNSYYNIIEIIRNNIQWLKEYNTNQTKSKRNLLNKWFLDSIKNYFMEQHAAPLLVGVLKCKSTQQVKEQIHSNIDESIPKYMSILKNYFDLLLQNNKVSEFKRNLIEMMSHNLEDFSSSNNQTNYIIQKTIRKQFVGLLVLTYCDISNQFEINSFYDLWNIIFPNDKQTKMRLSKYDMIKENESEKFKNSNKRKIKCIKSQYENITSNSQSQQQFLNKINICYPSPLSSFTSTLNTINTNVDTTNNSNLIQTSEQLFEECNSINTYSQEELDYFENIKESYIINNNQNKISQTNISQINRDSQSENGASQVSQSCQLNQQIINQQNIQNSLIDYSNNINTQSKQTQNNHMNEQNPKIMNQINIPSQCLNSNQYEYQSQITQKYNQVNMNLAQQQQYQSNQVTAHNLKQLEIYYQIQNEQQQQETTQANGADNHSSLSVNLNSDPEFLSSSSSRLDDFDHNDFLNNYQKEEYIQYSQQQVMPIDTYANAFEYSKCQISYNKKDESARIPINEVLHHPQQCYQEYPQYVNEQYQQYPYEQQDNFTNIFYANQFSEYQDNKEEFIDSIFNPRQYI